MTTVRFLSRPAILRAKSAGEAWLVLLVLCCLSSSLAAQQPARHWLHAGVMPPGAIGAQRMLRNGPLSLYPQPAYVQPTLLLAGDAADDTQLEPATPSISVASGDGFSEEHYGQLLVGLQVGRPYRFRVSGVPFYEDVEIYPTVELIDRLHPPPGKATAFPVPIELTTRELQMAARGAFITRVIYVEDPRQALPVEQKRGESWIEVPPDQDPLLAADELGRPIAILRIGARGPSSTGPSSRFTFGDPPVQFFDQGLRLEH